MMLRYRPRAWCVICPMGTMTQAICRAKVPKEMGTAAIGERSICPND